MDIKERFHNKLQTIREQADQMNEAKDEREYGYEGDMAITQLKTICRNAENLMKMMKPDTDLPEWVQSKITKSEDYISTAHDYLASEMNEEAEQLDELTGKGKLDNIRLYHKNKADQYGTNAFRIATNRSDSKTQKYSSEFNKRMVHKAKEQRASDLIKLRNKKKKK